VELLSDDGSYDGAAETAEGGTMCQENWGEIGEGKQRVAGQVGQGFRAPSSCRWHGGARE